MKVKVRGRCRPGGRGWAAGESCEERVEGVDVKVKVQTQVEESGLQRRVVGRGEKV